MRPKIASLSVLSLVGLTLLSTTEADAAVGGPDAFGYTFRDQADGQQFAYFDISATGTLVVSGDDVVASIALPAPFTFYGTTYTDFAVSTNGFITDIAGAVSDFSNDCPLPTPPGSGAGSFRVAALHDDLVTDVYYQFIDEATAAAIGFPGQVEGVSIFQWQGTFFSGGAVDVEVAFSHTFGDILSIVQVDDQGGASSTMGIQDPSGTIGLNYTCNTAGGVIPGVTAVAYFDPALGGAGTDCCAASVINATGCSDAVCEAAVCAFDPFCCDTEWDGQCGAEAGVVCTQCPAPVTINEIRIDQPGTDNDEYFELAGPPGASLDGLTYLVIGDSPTGTIEAVVDLSGQVIPASGLFVAAEGTFSLGTADFTTNLNFENTDTVTHMVVANFTGSNGDNLDANADGVFDSLPWSVVMDQVAIVDPGSAELPYGPPLACTAGATCNEVATGATAMHVYRCPDIDGGFNVGADDIAAPVPTDSPGAPNPCACGDGIVNGPEECDDVVETAACDADCTFATCGDGTVNMTALEDCDDGGESATCNVDCTTASCGDGVLNTTAGETCDDGGRSAMCNADCTSATCGDGIVNATAGEECDGDGAGTPGETATCDDDCTTAMCGDMVTNTTAGEECDDGAESAACNDDCTAAACGDGITNMTAGEECDDSNTDDGDGCASDCTLEGGGSTGGSDSGGSDSGMADSGDTGGADSTGGGADSTGGGSTGGPGDGSGGVVTTGPGVTSVTGDGSDGSGGSGDDTGGASSDDSGCGCTTGKEHGTTWTLLTLFGLVGWRRRRRNA